MWDLVDPQVAVGMLGGAAIFALVAGLQRHPRRRRVWVPFSLGIASAAYLLLASYGPGWTTSILAGFAVWAACFGTIRPSLTGVFALATAAYVFFAQGLIERPHVSVLLPASLVVFVVSLWTH